MMEALRARRFRASMAEPASVVPPDVTLAASESATPTASAGKQVPPRRERTARFRRKLAWIGPHPLVLGHWLLDQIWVRAQRAVARHLYGFLVSRPRGSELRLPVIELAHVADLPEALVGAAHEIKRAADAAAAHYADLLGSGPTYLGEQIDWHRDFKSGYRWHPRFYQDVEVTRLEDASDAKVPWELSRAHQLVALARAAVLFDDPSYAREAIAQWESWLAANPAGMGINWTTAMEVGLRAVSWVVAAATLEGRSALPSELRKRLAQSLASHAAHIELNLEGDAVLRSNHYVANVLGLFVLGLFIDDPRARRWRRRGRRALEREIYRQVYGDGLDFEASLPYHGLVLEMFEIAHWAATVAGRPLSARYEARLRLMTAASQSLRHPSGRMPQFGDCDSGRVIPATEARPPTHDHLIWLGAALLGDGAPLEGLAHAEVAWLLGVSAWHRLTAAPATHRALRDDFHEGGCFVLRDRASEGHLVLRCGSVGQRGNGGHAHNDALSFELSWHEPWIVDSGTYVYTADPAARNTFRSAASHNVPVVDATEPNVILPRGLFTLPQQTQLRARRLRVKHGSALEAELAGISTPNGLVTVRRYVAFDDDGGVQVLDSILGRGSHEIRSRLHFAQDVSVKEVGADYVLTVRRDRGVRVDVQCGAGRLEIGDAWISDRYGVREKAPVLTIIWDGALPAELGYSLRPTGPEPARPSQADAYP